MNIKYNILKLKKNFLRPTVIIFIFLSGYDFIKNKYKANQIRVCLCTLGKNENRYINEFVEHYKKYNIDKIFIYDNNDINGEKFEEKLLTDIEKGFVEINNWRGLEKVQFKIMNDCYNKNYNKFDWFIFYDIDEFIYLKYFNNIKEFLNQQIFNKCDKIELNWIHRVEKGDLLSYDNRPLSVRFKYKEKNILKKDYYPQIKSIIRGHYPNITIGCLHKLTSGLRSCNGFGKKSINIDGIKTMMPDYKINYINHYYGKSLEEFIEKIKRGSAAIGRTNISIIAKINRYFDIYDIEEKKINYMEKKLFINLSNYKMKLKQMNKSKNKNS